MQLLLNIRLTATIIGATYANYCFAVIIRPDRDDQEYRALAAEFPAACWIPDIVPSGTNHGTGTLISPRWVLTAAHVVSPTTTSVDGKVVEIRTQQASQVEVNGSAYDIKRIVFHPNYRNADFTDGQCDIALIELVRPVKDVTPLPIYRGDNEVGQLTHLVGFGWTGTFDSGQPSGDGEAYHTQVPTKRAATNIIDKVDGNLLITTIDPSSKSTDLEGGLATADSGGPLLVEVDGHYEVAGVAHILYGDEDKFQHLGGQDAYTRVSTYASWIDDTTQEDGSVATEPIRWAIAGCVLLAAFGYVVRRLKS